MNEQDVLEKIRRLKAHPFGTVAVAATLPARHGAGSGTVFTLKLLTADCATNAEIIGLLSRWRKQNEFWFQAIFPVSPSGTARWFERQVTGIPDRLLFVVETESRYVGHVGLFRFDFATNACEIDNIVRGEPGHPGIMGAACDAMMDWGRRELELQQFKLQTYSDNARALALYTRMGFVEVKRIPMKRVASGDRVDWLPLEAGENVGPIVRSNVYMELQRES